MAMESVTVNRVKRHCPPAPRPLPEVVNYRAWEERLDFQENQAALAKRKGGFTAVVLRFIGKLPGFT